MALEGNVTLPGGAKVPKQAAVAGVAAVAVLVGVYYYRKHKQAQQAPAATPTDQYPPDGTVGNPQDPYSTDPATGQTYGDEALGSGGTFGAFGGLGSGGGSGGGDGSGGGSGGPPFADNPSWANWTIGQLLATNPNLDPGQLTDAIGVYLAGQQASATQKTLIFDAIAVGGDPPVAGPNGYPPKVQTGGNGGGFASNPPAGLKATVHGPTARSGPGSKAATADLSWDTVQGATSYTVNVRDAHNNLFSSHQVTGTTLQIVNLALGARYTVYVIANPKAPGAREASTSFTTPR